MCLGSYAASWNGHKLVDGTLAACFGVREAALSLHEKRAVLALEIFVCEAMRYQTAVVDPECFWGAFNPLLDLPLSGWSVIGADVAVALACGIIYIGISHSCQHIKEVACYGPPRKPLVAVHSFGHPRWKGRGTSPPNILEINKCRCCSGSYPAFLFRTKKASHSDES